MSEILKDQSEFKAWFESQYPVVIEFEGEELKAPPITGRQSGRTFWLVAKGAWAAWRESRRSKAFSVEAGLFGGMAVRSTAQRRELLNAVKQIVAQYDAAPDGPLGKGFTNGPFFAC